MSTADDSLAARYALGVADLSEIVAAEARLESDRHFAAEVARYDAIFAAFYDEAAVETPSAGVWDRIEAAIDDSQKSPQTRTLRTEGLAWEPFAPGIDRKLLYVDKAAATQISLFRLSPGSGVMGHSHALMEECLVVEGEIEVDGITIRKGDLHLALPGSRHGPLTSRTGAVLYVRADLEFRL